MPRPDYKKNTAFTTVFSVNVVLGCRGWDGSRIAGPAGNRFGSDAPGNAGDAIYSKLSADESQ